MKYDWLEKV